MTGSTDCPPKGWKKTPFALEMQRPLVARNRSTSLSLLQTYSTCPADIAEFAKRPVAAIGLGNGGAHFKNRALMFSDDRNTLRVPLYDSWDMPCRSDGLQVRRSGFCRRQASVSNASRNNTARPKQYSS
jgi:hypothetical protein